MTLIATDTSIPGAKLLTLDRYSDDRGFFKETYSQKKYDALGITDAFMQDNVSLSYQNVVRGLHAAPATSKLVHVLLGEIWDVIVDARPDSPAYGTWEGFNLSDGNQAQLYIPEGCLHGFIALTERVVFLYKVSAPYDPKTEYGVRWNDPTLGIPWPLQANPIVSKKDQDLPLFQMRKEASC